MGSGKKPRTTKGMIASGRSIGTEGRSIGTERESSLHAALKARYARSCDVVEARVAGKVVDVARLAQDGSLEGIVEVQTGNFGKIQSKILALAALAPVTIAYPVAVEKTLVTLDPDSGEVLRTRKSPKRQNVWSVFDDLVNASALMGTANVSFDVVAVRVRETRVSDGKGSWRRRGVSIRDREADAIGETRSFYGPDDWARLLPLLAEPFAVSDLARAAGIPAVVARKAVYCLAKAGIVEENGKRGRAKLWKRADPFGKGSRRKKARC